jgi:hypothetical protein
MAIVGGLGAVVALASGVVGLVFVLRPGLKPKPPPAHTAVHLSRVSFDRGVTFAQYLARADQPAGGLDRQSLRRRGALLTLHFDIIGYEGKRLPLRWHLLELRGGRQLGEQRAITITGTSAEDEGDWPVWVPAPPRPGRYAIDVELLNPQGTVPLATLRSPSFAG